MRRCHIDRTIIPSLVILASVLVIFVTIVPLHVQARLREGECEVCLKRIDEMSSALADVKDAAGIEAGIKSLCRSYTDRADQRFCYYIGGSDDAATSLLRTVSGAMLNHLPAVKICDKLKGADGQICAVRYEAPPKPIDWSTIDLNKMRVKELKHILDGWNEKCEGCTEKGDYLRLINQVKHKHITTPTDAAANTKDL